MDEDVCFTIHMAEHEDEIFVMKFLECDTCEYKTQDKSHATRHSKSCNGVMNVVEIPMVSIDYANELMDKTAAAVTSTMTIRNTNINIHIPESVIDEEMLEFLKTLAINKTISSIQIEKNKKKSTNRDDDNLF
ncbi:protein of unknown function (DUF1390) [Paramecium bursaria Chlorella virus NYs1]|uniref:C2H2-type domain-containing protein n=1 Tax=Paramecium bursaria Chlorella virus NYs1 TaxID=83442 RepID=M1HHH8_9PHYC|nr:protein of unknown function (DUF1390) [Paramecium bursaria Chlorella virus NYs1]AGE54268.1 protein of unknown function (DUF1390) [Paramecium bursaria Chlorella virus IL-5-2s1]AGE54908.1 protein of unknown function (DUF1390) [Paramecium bursaria Chlorella virus MA1D]AGE58768.1 protein of unknown function (DUF1390) [Paramecium bursaria Chlorella virus NYs1]